VNGAALPSPVKKLLVSLPGFLPSQE